MMHKTWVMTLPLVLLLLVAGCAVPQKARDDASLLAAYTNKVKSDAERYRSFRDDLAKARWDNMHLLERDTLEVHQETVTFVGAWEAAEDRGRIRLYNAVVAAAAEAADQQDKFRELLEKQKHIRKETKTLFKVRSEKLQETAKALAALGKQPDYEAQGKYLVDFFREVKKSVDEANAEAKEQAERGQDEGKTSNASEGTERSQ